MPYADIVLPDTTYLERWDCISLLDWPICSADGPADAIRQPVLQPDRDVRAFQSVMLDLGARLGPTGMTNEMARPNILAAIPITWSTTNAHPVLACQPMRGEKGDSDGTGGVNPDQLNRYIENGCF